MDLSIYETGNGGDLILKNGDLEITEGLTNQPYLAHFGGNKEASTTGEEIQGTERLDWWGNSFFINDEAGQMNSELERALDKNNLSSSGRIEIENQAKEDLKFLADVAEISTNVSILDDDKVQISDKLSQPDNEKFLFIWDATKNELIEDKII